MCWQNYTAEIRCFTWSTRRCPEACCCVPFLGLQSLGLLQSFSLLVRVFSGYCKVSRREYVLFRAAAKFLVVCVCFYLGLLQSFSLCERTFSFELLQSFSLCVRAFLGLLQSFSLRSHAFSFGLLQISFSSCAFTLSFSLCVCTFFSGCCKAHRCVGVLLIGLPQSVFFRASAKFLVVCARFSRVTSKSCCKIFSSCAFALSFSLCVYTIFSGCCKAYRCAGVLLTGLPQSVFFWATAKFLVVCACFSRATAKFLEVCMRFLPGCCKVSRRVSVLFPRTAGC